MGANKFNVSKREIYTMRRVFAVWMLLASACFADRPIFLVTPQGVWQSTVTEGKPGPWVAIAADVIVQGFPSGNPPDNPPTPVPPADDPIVKQIEAISWIALSGKGQATAVAAIVDSIGKLGLSEKDFKEAMDMAIPIADTSIEADKKLIDWWDQCSKITTDWKKLKAGVSGSWDVDAEAVDAIHAAATNPGAAVTGEAVNWTKLIEIIMMILTLLKNLGIGGGT